MRLRLLLLFLWAASGLSLEPVGHLAVRVERSQLCKLRMQRRRPLPGKRKSVLAKVARRCAHLLRGGRSRSLSVFVFLFNSRSPGSARLELRASSGIKPRWIHERGNNLLLVLKCLRTGCVSHTLRRSGCECAHLCAARAAKTSGSRRPAGRIVSSRSASRFGRRPKCVFVCPSLSAIYMISRTHRHNFSICRCKFV